MKKEGVKIELGQVEDSDIPLLKGFANSGFAQYLGLHAHLSINDLAQILEFVRSQNDIYLFSIKVRASGDFKNVVKGFAAFSQIDWVARHAKIDFIKVDRDNNLKTIQESEEAFNAFKMCLEYGFQQLNFNKIWTEVLEGHNIKLALNNLGFVAEGVREQCAFVKGEVVSSTVCSILSSERKYKC